MKYFLLAFAISFLSFLSGQTLQAQFIPKEKRSTPEAPDSSQNKAEKREKKEKSRLENSPSKSRKKQGDGSSFLENITFGGNLGGGFGNPTFVDLSPTIGYQLSDKLELGLGPNYAYYHFKEDVFRADDHLYGGRAYGQYKFFKSAFVRGEIEGMRVTLPDSSLALEAPVRREWQVVPLAGAGLEFKLLGLVRFQFTLLYNPLHEDGRSWRGTPWITRFGFGF